MRPVREGDPYPIMDDNLPEGFIERVAGGYVCGTCRALVTRREDAPVHQEWHRAPVAVPTSSIQQ